MCYFCKTNFPKKYCNNEIDYYNIKKSKRKYFIHPHKSINCKNPKNLYSGFVICGIQNEFCKYCNKYTHHFWHKNNGLEKKFLRCSVHS
jgi:hypothetical protein